jgi:hypothetical protein
LLGRGGRAAEEVSFHVATVTRRPRKDAVGMALPGERSRRMFRHMFVLVWLRFTYDTPVLSTKY